MIDRRLRTIIVDTREKRPLVFADRRIHRAKLDVGDYTLRGFSKLVVVEYKSLNDWYSWIRRDKPERFNSQVERLLEIPRRAVVVGAPLAARSRTSSVGLPTVLKRVALLSSLGIPVIFCQGRIMAAKFIEHFLTEGAKQ